MQSFESLQVTQIQVSLKVAQVCHCFTTKLQLFSSPREIKCMIVYKDSYLTGQCVKTIEYFLAFLKTTFPRVCIHIQWPSRCCNRKYIVWISSVCTTAKSRRQIDRIPHKSFVNCVLNLLSRAGETDLAVRVFKSTLHYSPFKQFFSITDD